MLVIFILQGELRVPESWILAVGRGTLQWSPGPALCPLDSDSAGLQLLLHCLGGKLSLSRHHGSGELPCYKETSFTDSFCCLLPLRCASESPTADS